LWLDNFPFIVHDVYIFYEGGAMSEKDPYLTRKTLIQRVRDQYDDRSWQEFADIYNRFIYSIIRKMNITSSDAEDILQKVLMKLWNVLPTLDPNEIRRFRSYLSTVTKNCVQDFMRQRKAQIEREHKAGTDATLSYLDSIRLPEIESIAEHEWEVFLTNMAFKNIQGKYSDESIDILKMFLAGKSIDEVADITGLEIKKVYNIRFRMKKRFADEIATLRKDLE